MQITVKQFRKFCKCTRDFFFKYKKLNNWFYTGSLCSILFLCLYPQSVFISKYVLCVIKKFFARFSNFYQLC